MLLRFFFSASFFLIASESFAQDIQAEAGSAPTSFTGEPRFSLLDEASKAISKTPGSVLQENGGQGKLQTISIRGSRPSDVAVSLEGIRLNSPSSGEFDFGKLSSFGLENARVIRGGYAPFSSDPSGQVLLRLPKEPSYKSLIGYGSYQSWSLGQELPFASVSLEQSENNFPYHLNGVEADRSDNESQRVNLRAWHRKENYQIWTQLLYADEKTPGPVNYPAPGSSQQTFNPTLAYQGIYKNWQWDLWGNFEQEFFWDTSIFMHTTNRWFTNGARLQKRSFVTQNIEFESVFEWSEDKLFSDQLMQSTQQTLKIRSPLRQTLSASTATFIHLSRGQLIHPRVRIEYVSDLKEDPFSAHPGIGGRHRIIDELSLLWNAAMISRAPNFGEMYFEIPSLALSNRSLIRQQSLQGDFGYDFRWEFLQLRQSFFANRTLDLLQGTAVGRLYQTQNKGTGVDVGLESEMELHPYALFSFVGQYTLQRASLNDHQQVYQPTHRLNLEPRIYPSDLFSIGLPFYARSSVATPQGVTIHEQYDLGVSLLAKRKRMSFEIRAFNLLAWDRSEIEYFPLSSEPWVKASASVQF